MVYTNLDKAFARVEELMIEQGPFDGLMGFSQVNNTVLMVSV